MHDSWADILINAFQEVATRLAGFAPRVLAVVTLVLAGWIVAAIARRLAIRILRAADVDGRSARWGIIAALGRTGIRRAPSELAGQLVFWVIVLIGMLMAIEALDVPAAAGLAPVVIRFLPNLLIAIFVMVFGWLLANFLAQALLIFIVNAQLTGGPALAGIVRWLVILFSASVALTQLGIAREMILLVFGIVFGGVTLALALAFGLGGRHLARQALEGWLRKRQGRGPDDMSHL
jgi:mechanosensitive ion channel-like protein